jgi:hypothetical protein
MRLCTIHANGAREMSKECIRTTAALDAIGTLPVIGELGFLKHRSNLCSGSPPNYTSAAFSAEDVPRSASSWFFSI